MCSAMLGTALMYMYCGISLGQGGWVLLNFYSFVDREALVGAALEVV